VLAVPVAVHDVEVTITVGIHDLIMMFNHDLRTCHTNVCNSK
jgi:hypothetical protein